MSICLQGLWSWILVEKRSAEQVTKILQAIYDLQANLDKKIEKIIIKEIDTFQRNGLPEFLTTDEVNNLYEQVAQQTRKYPAIRQFFNTLDCKCKDNQEIIQLIHNTIHDIENDTKSINIQQIRNLLRLVHIYIDRLKIENIIDENINKERKSRLENIINKKEDTYYLNNFTNIKNIIEKILMI